MTGYRILLGLGAVFTFVSLMYALQLPVAYLILIWTVFSICAPLVYLDPKGILLGLWGSGMTALGTYLIFVIEPFRTDVHLFDRNHPAESEAWFFLGVLLCWFGLALTIGGIISADRKGVAS